MFILYDLIFLLIAIIYSPFYLFKRKFHCGFLARFGILPRDISFNKPIWIHAVSVGEVMAVKNLVRELRVAYPEKRFFISTVTPTGNKIARAIAKETDFVFYFPLDLSFIVRSVVDKVKPSLFIIMETEIWPNLVSSLYQKNIPIVLVNGRLSDRSFRGYLSIKFLLKPILNKINLFCVQTKSDAERLLCLGVSRDRIQITGNMKFDINDYTDFKKDYTDNKRKLDLKPEEKLWVAASTHPAEEEIIVNVYKKLLDGFPNLKLLIAPRHPERAGDIEKIVARYGFSSFRVSQLASWPVSAFGGSACGGNQLNRQTGKPANGSAGSPSLEPSRAKSRGRQTIFLLDTIGQLLSFYSIADIVFVGGSLIKKGGHNILEPASLGKPVIFGPYMFNFRDIARLFLENKACVIVHNSEELLLNIKDLLRNPDRSNQLSQRAKAIILQNKGATARNLECILNLNSTSKPQFIL